MSGIVYGTARRWYTLRVYHARSIAIKPNMQYNFILTAPSATPIMYVILVCLVRLFQAEKLLFDIYVSDLYDSIRNMALPS